MFCEIFLYWYSASLASFPFFCSTDSSTKRSITGSKDVIGTLRDRLEVMCSCSKVKAAGAWLTPISSLARFRTFSGF